MLSFKKLNVDFLREQIELDTARFLAFPLDLLLPIWR